MKTLSRNLESNAFRGWADSGYPRGILEERGEVEDLLQAFESVADERAEETAIFLKDPRTGGAEARYLALSFSELRLERDAWMHRLRSAGVTDEDRVLLWLPKGLAMVAATYALLRMGVEVALAEESMEWGEGLGGFEPTVALVSSPVLGKCRRELKEGCQFLEVKSPLLRVAAGVKSSQPRRLAKRETTSGIALFREDADGRRRAARFGGAALAAMVSEYRKALRIQEFETDVPGDCLMSVLNAALGVSSVFTEAGFGMGEEDAIVSLLGAVEDLGVSLLTRGVGDWERILSCSEQALRDVNRVFVEGTVADLDRLRDGLASLFPNAELYSVFGTLCLPIAATCGERFVEGGVGFGGAGERIGRLLGGLRERIVVSGTRVDLGEGLEELGRIGELCFEGGLCGTVWGEGELAEGQLSCSSGYFGFEDDGGSLRVCGRVGDAVRASFGVLVPCRCEPVFERHAAARKVVLIGVSSKAGVRPGIVVEVEDGCLPGDALSESKFRAELMRLGAESNDTKLILDMFFVDRLPESKGRGDGVDRAALSRRYSMLAKLKAVF